MRHLLRVLSILAFAAAVFSTVSAQSPAASEPLAIHAAPQTRLVVFEAFMREG